MKKNHQFRIKMMRAQRKTSGALNKLSKKAITLPEVYEKDDATINFVKKTGGQVFQNYSLKDTEIRVQDNFKYYYILSDMYPATQDSEDIVLKSEDFKVTVRKIRMNSILGKDTFSSDRVFLTGVESAPVIEYSYYGFPNVDSTYSKTTRFSLENEYVIKYTYENLPTDDEVSGTGFHGFKFTSELFSIITEELHEKSYTEVNSFNIQVRDAK